MTVLYFILLVGVLIFVHELGHFLFAKLFDVKVLKFSLGFGPCAYSFRRGETDYCLAWVPLGGFVKMLGDDPSEEIGPQDEGRAFRRKPLWQRYVIVFAGPVFNIIFPTLIYLLFFALQTEWSPPVVGQVSAGQPAAEAGLLPGDRIVAIDGRPIRYWRDGAAADGGLWSVSHNIASRPGERLRFTIERQGRIVERFITPKPHERRTRLGTVERYGLLGISPYVELAQIGIADPAAPAARAGLRTGDLITAVNGKPVRRWADLQRWLAAERGRALRLAYLRPRSSASAFFDLHVLDPGTVTLSPAPDPEGRPSSGTGILSADLFVQVVKPNTPAARMGLEAGDRIVSLDGERISTWDLLELRLNDEKEKEHTLSWVTPSGRERTARFSLAKRTYVDDYKHEQEQYVFGASNGTIWQSPEPIPATRRVAYSLIESVRKTAEIVGVMAVAIVQVIRGEISRDTVGGPVMLAHTARVAAEKGWDHFLWMMALISINLGILNLLPIPILDGGHIMLFTVEAVKRRPLSLRAREIASYVGLFLLISLMVFALKNDIVRYWFK